MQFWTLIWEKIIPKYITDPLTIRQIQSSGRWELFYDTVSTKRIFSFTVREKSNTLFNVSLSRMWGNISSKNISDFQLAEKKKALSSFNLSTKCVLHLTEFQVLPVEDFNIRQHVLEKYFLFSCTGGCRQEVENTSWCFLYPSHKIVLHFCGSMFGKLRTTICVNVSSKMFSNLLDKRGKSGKYY